MIRPRRLPLVLLALVLWTPAAHAEPKDDARRHFLAGLAAAKEQDFQKALDEFLAAQAAYPHPASLYNIARSYMDLGDLDNALKYFLEYRGAAPDKVDDIDPVINVIRSKIALRDAPPPAPEVPAATPATTPATGVDSADVARIQALAKEFSTLAESIAARATAPPPVATTPATPTTGTEPTTPTPPTGTETTASTAVPDQGELLSDAYERVVVTASRYGQSPLDSPSTVTILTDQDIAMSGATTIPDLLRRVVGVDVMAMSASQPDLSIRGFNREISNKVLVLVDGRSVYLDFLGVVVWEALGVSLDEIERIEVIRGPGSAIYGANAMTGVVNIITRPPGEGESLVHVQGGAPAYASGTVLANGRKGPTSWRMSAGWDQMGRWSSSAELGEDTPLVPFLENQDLAMQNARANVRIDRAFLDKGLASVSAAYSRLPNEFYNIGALGDFAMDATAGYARGDLAYGPVHFRTFYNTLRGDVGPWLTYEGASRDLTSPFNSQTLDAELEANGELKTGPVAHRFNAGLDYRYKNIAIEYLVGQDPIAEHHYAAFLQDEAKIGPLALVASLRADRTPYLPISETISPRGAAIIRVADRTSVRVTGGTSYRAPTLLENYVDLDQPTSADGIYVHTRGGTDILPERILTGEVGMHDESTNFHNADVALYVNRVTNLIGVDDVVPEVSFYDEEDNGFAAGTVYFQNLPATYLAVGGEAEGRLFPLDGLDVYANVSVERILQQEDGVTTLDQSESLVKVNAGAMYRTPFRVDVSAHVNFVSDQVWTLREYDNTGTLVATDVAVPARTIVTARVAGRPFADDRLEIGVAGWNLGALTKNADGEFNTFREHPNGQLVGARYWGEVTWRF